VKINEIESVDKVAIRKLLVKHFKLTDNVTIDDNGFVSTKGSVVLIISHKVNKLPVKFLHVGESFECYSNNLITLEGCPQTVKYNFYCDHNQLTSLEGGPEEVGGNYSCYGNPLTTLAGLPTTPFTSIYLTYSPTLPLMRTLIARDITFYEFNKYIIIQQIQELLNSYAGQGKSGMMKCSSELLTLGKKFGLDLRHNARW